VVLSSVLWGRGDFVRTIGCCPIVSDLSGRASLKEWANHQLLLSGVCAARLFVHLCLLQSASPNSLSARPEAAELPVESIDLRFSSDRSSSKEIPDVQGKFRSSSIRYFLWHARRSILLNLSSDSFGQESNGSFQQPGALPERIAAEPNGNLFIVDTTTAVL
jgi:hypothetical protein